MLTGRRVAALVGALVVVLSILARAADPYMMSSLRGSGFDSLQRLWPRLMSDTQPVRIIDIDEASLAKLGQWPWSRKVMAKLVDEAMELGAAVVAFDIVFAEPDRLSPKSIAAEIPGLASSTILEDYDATFSAAMAGRPVVLAMASTGSAAPTTAPIKTGFAQTGLDATRAPARLQGITTALPQFNAGAAGIGSISIDLSREQGVARQIPMLLSTGERLVPSLVVEALRVAQGADTLLLHASPDTENAIESLAVGDLAMPLSERGELYVYYRNHDPALMVSAVRLISGEERETLRPLLEGHVLFVGASAVGLLDIRTTALGETVPGVSVHAQATEQILAGQFLTRPEWGVALEYWFVFLAGLGLAFFGAWAKPWKTLLALAVALLTTGTAVAASFRGAGLLLDTTFPFLALLLTAASVIAMRLLVTDREGRMLRQAFGQYVAADVLTEIENNPQALKLGGEMRDVTVMFVDIANFTPLSEKLSPQELVLVVNRLLDAVSTEILAERGTIDKYIGDAVMAFWNAPVSLPDHQFHAARAALGIRRAIEKLNREPLLAELPQKYGIPPLAVRVGMASGEACVGNMGSTTRFDYSVLGETVNIAARAEGTGKHIGHDIVLAGPLLGKSQAMAWLDGGAVEMKGKSGPQVIHALVDHDARPSFMTLKSDFDGMMSLRSIKKRVGRVRELAARHPELSNFFSKLPERFDEYQ